MAVASTDLGAVSLIPKGEYSSSVFYERLSLVTYQGSSYVAIKGNTNIPLTNTTYWQKITEKGEKGDKGDKGDQGDQGIQGIQGIQGPKGEQGDAFRIKKTYPTVAAMNADFNNMQYNDYVMIASSVETEDNAKLYVRGEQEWLFISDFSGAQGIKGEKGDKGDQGIQGIQGEQGIQGPQGNGITSITKTSTEGLVDTYTITYDDGSTETFQITNGEDGSVTQEQFEELQEQVEILKNTVNSELEDGTAIGEEISVTDSANAPAKLLPSGNTYQDGEPSPTNEVPIHNVSGHNEFLVQNKNWFDEKNPLHYSTDASGNTNMSTIYNSTDYIKCNNEDTWAISGKSNNPGDYAVKLVFYDENKNFISRPIANANGGVAQTPVNAKYVMGQFFTTTSNCLFEKNTKSTSYVPHEEQTLELDLPEGMEMCKIGDYEDTFEIQNGKWYMSKKISKLSLAIANMNNANDYPGWREVTQIKNNFPNKNSLLAELTSYKLNIGTTGIAINTTGNDAILYLLKSVFKLTQTEWKEQYPNLILELYYGLTTPNLIEITDQTLISQLDTMQKVLSYYGGTNITTISAEDLKPILNFDYKKSNRLRDDNQDKEIENIKARLDLLEG